jgi:hypothetical protein
LVNVQLMLHKKIRYPSITLAHRLPIPTKQPGVHKQNQNASNKSILVVREEVRVVLTNEMGMGKLFHSARCIAYIR